MPCRIQSARSVHARSPLSRPSDGRKGGGFFFFLTSFVRYTACVCFEFVRRGMCMTEMRTDPFGCISSDRGAVGMLAVRSFAGPARPADPSVRPWPGSSGGSRLSVHTTQVHLSVQNKNYQVSLSMCPFLSAACTSICHMTHYNSNEFPPGSSQYQ